MLDRILPGLPEQADPNLLVGMSTLDDAGVYKINDDLALVQTVDFFTPIVDDPYDYGRISAANSLSDVYAMGGKPVTAMNIVAFPAGEIPEDTLLKILQGADEVCKKAEIVTVGGHSVSDKELKFGLSVSGTIHPDRILTNAGGKAGDALLLTKPLGSGLIANAMMNDSAKDEDVQASTDVMVRLNKVASEAALEFGAHSVTDVSGFGLLGHAKEMASASGLEITLFADKMPVIQGALEVATSGSFYSGGERRNRKYVDSLLCVNGNVSEALQRIVADPQTSGGLLVALDRGKVDSYIEYMKKHGEEAWLIGGLSDGEPGRLHLVVSSS